MLIPQNRLFLVVAIVALPLAIAAGLRPETIVPVAVLLALFVAAGLIDASIALRRAGRDVTFRFPALVRVFKGRAAELVLVARDDRPPTGAARHLRVALAWPDAIHATAAELPLDLRSGGAVALSWACTPLRRGRFLLDRLYFQEDSPLGFWAVRRSQPAACELRVYPDLRTERRRAAAVFLTRGGLGVHAQRQVGRGREFDKLRDYLPGDSIEDISWKATARRRRPVSKVFQVERTQEVFLIVDASRLSGRPLLTTNGSDESAADGTPDQNDVVAHPPPTILERYVASSLMICLAAERQGDHFGLVTFDAGVRRFLRAGNGAAHFDACREAIYALEPAPVSPDFDEIGSFLRLRMRRRALLIFLTSLDDPIQAEGLARALEYLGRQHVVIVGTLRPAGVAPLFADVDGGAGVQTTGQVYERLAGHLQWQRLKERENLLRRRNIRVALLDPERVTEQLVNQYMNIKRRQIL